MRSPSFFAATILGAAVFQVDALDLGEGQVLDLAGACRLPVDVTVMRHHQESVLGRIDVVLHDVDLVRDALLDGRQGVLRDGPVGRIGPVAHDQTEFRVLPEPLGEALERLQFLHGNLPGGFRHFGGFHRDAHRLESFGREGIGNDARPFLGQGLFLAELDRHLGRFRDIGNIHLDRFAP